MTWNRRAQDAMIAIFFCVLAAVYAVAWSLPAIGFDHDDAGYLVTANAIAAGHGESHYPPLFPVLLALFTLVSRHALWLKLLPLACAGGWLAMTRKLLLKMGASTNGALLLVGLAAASPTIVFLSTNLLPQTLFALLVTAALFTLLEERAFLAGFFAGLATLTQTAGVALIVACILTLVVRRRLRSAAIFTAVAMVMAAPWFGWSLAHAGQDGNFMASTVLTGLAANEKLVVLSRNLLSLLGSPFSLLMGFTTNILFVVGTIVILISCFIARRQLVPDLFVALYCVVLLCRISSPERLVAPILPLVFWIVWRVLRLMATREALAVLVVIAIGFPLWADAVRILPARRQGYFSIAGVPGDKWSDMQTLFAFIRANTGPDSVLLADLDATLFLHTARKTVRGFVPNAFDLFYGAPQSAVTPDELSNAIVQAKVDYVALTPDRGLAESPSFHKSVEALERGGVVEPVSILGAPRGYRLLKVLIH
jgi:hypothetical protein